MFNLQERRLNKGIEKQRRLFDKQEKKRSNKRTYNILLLLAFISVMFDIVE